MLRSLIECSPSRLPSRKMAQCTCGPGVRSVPVPAAADCVRRVVVAFRATPPLEFIAADADERHSWVVALAFVHSMFPVAGPTALS